VEKWGRGEKEGWGNSGMVVYHCEGVRVERGEGESGLIVFHCDRLFYSRSRGSRAFALMIAVPETLVNRKRADYNSL